MIESEARTEAEREALFVQNFQLKYRKATLLTSALETVREIVAATASLDSDDSQGVHWSQPLKSL